jgi:hypothetical protein
LQENFHAKTFNKSAPGSGELIGIIILSTIAIFMRMIFVSYEDLAKLAKIQAMSAGNSEWEAILITEMCAEVFCTLTVFLSIFLVYRLEHALTMAHMYTTVDKVK